MQSYPTPARSSVWQAVSASTIGTIVEWYDFYIYGTAAALVFSKLFFPTLDPLAGILASYAAYAVGFLVRPLGGVLFAYFGDKYGRKPVLIATLLLMGLSTAAIGLLPTYDSIGIAAPILLTLLRVFQGLGAGAEYSGAVLMSAEYSADRKGFWASFPPMAVDGAIVLSAGVFALFSLLPSDAFLAWGWRIPFLLSLVAVAIGYFVRRRILETPEFTSVAREARAATMPVWELIRTRPRAVLIAMGANVIMNVGYVYQVYVLSYMTKQLGVSQNTALISLVIAATCGGCASIFFGSLSDRIGRRRVMLFGSIFTALYAFPFFWLLETRNPVLIAVAMTIGLVVGLRTVFGVQPAFYAELFPVRFRFSGIALARETTGAFIGGPLPLLATWLVAEAGGASWPVAALMVLMALITAVSVAAAPAPIVEPLTPAPGETTLRAAAE